MSTEYWGILSPNDHRKQTFRSTLLLFDRIVVPDSASLANDLSPEESSQFHADTDYLSDLKIVQKVHIDRRDLEAWCRKVSSSDTGEIFKRWPNCASRYYLQHRYNNLLTENETRVVAVPLYLNPKFFDIICSGSDEVDENQKILVEIILPRFPVISERVSLQDVLFVRQRKSFEESLKKLRAWQQETLPELIYDPSSQSVKSAAKDFERYVTQYQTAISDLESARLETCLRWAFFAGAALDHHPAVGLLVKSLLEFWNPKHLSARQVFTPAWKLLIDKPFAPAGIIHEASKLSDHL